MGSCIVLVKLHFRCLRLSAVLTSAALLLGFSPVFAGTLTWDGGAGDDFWASGLNWSGDVAPQPGDSLIFAGAVPLLNTNNLPAGTPLDQLTFSFSGYVIRGAALKLSNRITVTHTLGSTSFNLRLTNLNTATFQVQSSRATLFLNGDIELDGHTSVFTGEGSVTVNGNISGLGTDSRLMVQGPGAVTLDASCTYNGTTTVDGGSLTVNSTITSSVLANPGTVLAGDGSVNSMDCVGCGIQPGDAGIGSLAASGPATLDSSSTLQIQMAGTTAGTMLDQLICAGSVSLSDPALTLILTGGFTPQIGQTFVILNKSSAGPISGTFAGLPEGASFNASNFVFQITYVGGSGANDVVLTCTGIQPTGVTRVWTGLGASAFATNRFNWLGNVAPVPGDALEFPPSPIQKTILNNYLAATHFHRLLFTGDGYSLSNNAMTLIAGVRADYVAGNPVVIRLPITLIQSQSVSNAAGTLEFDQGINLGPHTLTFEGGGTTIVSGAIVGAGDLDKEGSGTLRLAGNNAYSGITSVGAGYLDVSHTNGLGSVATPTQVFNMGTLRLFNDLILREPIATTGKLISESGTNLLSGPFTTHDSNAVIEVKSGSLLEITAAMDGQGGFYKTGPGTLVLSGAIPNTYLTTTFVQEGLLRLEKFPGITAIPANLAIGDALGAPGSDVVRLGAPNQIHDNAIVTVFGSGQLDLNGHNDLIQILHTVDGRVTTGAGLLSITGDLVANPVFNGAHLSGNLGLVGGGLHGVNVGAGLVEDDLVIDANITAQAGAGLQKVGPGRMVLNGQNLFQTLQLSEGDVFVNGSQPLTPIQLLEGRLGGTGTVGVISGDGGFVTPGSSPGILASSNLVWTLNITFEVEVHGPNPGLDHDQLLVNGTVNLGFATLLLSNTAAFPLGTALVIIANDGTDPVIGMFGGLPEGALLTNGPTLFGITYAGGTGNDVVLLATNPPIAQATRIWDGGGSADRVWTSPLNWVGDIAPNPGDHLVFPSSAPAATSLQNDFPANTTFGFVAFGQSNTITGNPMTLTSGLILTQASGSVICSTPIHFSGTQSIDIGGSGLGLSLNGSSCSFSGQLAFRGSGTTFVSVPLAGSGTLLVADNATVQLLRANDYSGLTHVIGGTLIVGHNFALGDASSLDYATRVEAAGQLLLFPGVRVSQEPLQLAGTLAFQSGFTGPAEWAGPIELLDIATMSVQPEHAGVLSGAISGPYGWSTSGGGSLEVRGTHSYAGTSTLLSGTLLINAVLLNANVSLVGGTLGGTGLVQTLGAATSGLKRIEPGHEEPGLLRCEDSLILDAFTTVAIQLNGLAPGQTHDQLRVGSQVSLHNASLEVTAGFSVPMGAAFVILEATSSQPTMGTFQGLAQNDWLGAGTNVFRISYTGGADGNDVVLTRVQAPPAQLTTVAFDQGGFHLEGQGLPNLPYAFLASSNLLHWSLLRYLSATPAGLLQTVDSDAAKFPARFYLILSP